MTNYKNSSVSLLEIRKRAQDLFLKNPLNEKARKIFLEAFVTKILNEEEDKFNLFGFDPSFENNIIQSELNEKEIIDPDFGLKASLCFGEVEEFQFELLKQIEKEGLTDDTKNILDPNKKYFPYSQEKGQIDTGEPGTDRKIGDLQLKYDKALGDLSKATSNKFQQKKRVPVVYKRGNVNIDVLNDIVDNTWIPFDRAKAANAVSSNNFKATISSEGAGELEFLARMYYACELNLSVSLEIPSKIKLQPGLSRDLVKKQETFLLNLGNGNLKGKIGDRCKAILETYMILAVRKILAPAIRFEYLMDYAYEGVEKALRKLIGIDEVSDEISEGKYNFSNANIGAWTYKVAKNYAIDQLKQYTKRVYDNSKAADFVYGNSYPYEIKSKIPTEVAKGNFSTSEERIDKLSGKKYYVYTYLDKTSLLKDLQMANGYYYDVNDNEEPSDKRGRKPIYQKNNPVYFKNVSDVAAGEFMTTIKKELELPDPIKTPSEIESQYVDKIEKKEAEEFSLNLVKNIKTDLRNITKEIIEKIIDEPNTEKYNQNKVKSFLSFNKELATEIIFRLFGYGIYKFVEKESIKEKRARKKRISAERKRLGDSAVNKTDDEIEKAQGTYDWMTKPELYLDDFIKSLETNVNLGQDLPQSVTNRLGKKSISIKEFIRLLKTAVLGSGKAGPELEKYFKTIKSGEEQTEYPSSYAGDEIFKKLAPSKGFLILNPSYLKRIYSLLKKLPAGEELGSEPQPRLDENVNKIHNIIYQLKQEFDIYNKSMIKILNF